MPIEPTDNAFQSVVNHTIEVAEGFNNNGDPVVLFKFYHNQTDSTAILTDRLTAARLINQLRRLLDQSA